eukprot:11728790-Karenia_brevis.AAC.1
MELGADSWLAVRAVGAFSQEPKAGIQDQAVVQYTEDWDGFKVADGPVFHDGSCTGPSTPYPRAAYGAVQITLDGKLIRGLWGPVPYPLDQTAVTAEHMGLAQAVRNSEPGCSL